MCRSDYGELRELHWLTRDTCDHTLESISSLADAAENHTAANQKHKSPTTRDNSSRPTESIRLSRCIQTGLRAYKVNQATGTRRISCGRGKKCEFCRRIRKKHSTKRAGRSSSFHCATMADRCVSFNGSERANERTNLVSPTVN